MSNRKPQHPPAATCRPPAPPPVRVEVFVEGWSDVAFWRDVFDRYQDEQIGFTISVPDRPDLAKGKRALLDMVDTATPLRIMCVDSDFDYLFDDLTPDSTIVNHSPYLFQTYAYSVESYLCYAPTLHSVAVRATLNDVRIFDFEQFLQSYSRTIHPLFLWYAFSAQQMNKHIFPLIDFKSSVKLNYLEIDDCGASTIGWIERQVARRLETLRRHHPQMQSQVDRFGKLLATRGLKPEDTYMYMQGHTLLDNVVMVMLHAVCERLQAIAAARIDRSTKQGVALHNERSNYNNALRNVRDVLLDNRGYRRSPQFQRLEADLDRYVADLKSRSWTTP